MPAANSTAAGNSIAYEPLSDVLVGDDSLEPEPQPEGDGSLPRVEMVGVVRLLEAGERWSEARGFPLTTVVGLDSVGLTRDD